MSIIVSGIRLPFDENDGEALTLALQQCGLRPDQAEASIYRVSIDARRGKVDRVYSVLLDGIGMDEAFAAVLQMPSVRYKAETILAPRPGSGHLPHRPVIVGFGPAGLFCAYLLAKYGFRPIVLERGDQIAERDQAITRFHQTMQLDENSNIQFGEGGAGTYSDGKLTTRINDPLCDTVLSILLAHGAPPEITKLAKPHIGTDVLKHVVTQMRRQIEAWGGEVHFRTPLTGLRLTNGRLSAVVADGQEITCERAVLALGHSARDTFFALHQEGVQFVPKAFSIGARIEHLQTEIDKAVYGRFAGHPLLPPGEYNLSHRENGRACYSFCMCPGGHVVAAQSEADTVVTNGMSYHARDGRNANAAIAVSVDPADFEDGTPFGGIALQRQVERAAFEATEAYTAPCQLVGDFLDGKCSRRFASVQPTYPMGTAFVPLDRVLPDFVVRQMQTGLGRFAGKLRAFAGRDAVLTAPETRTSSPVRMCRGEDLCSLTAPGVMPCGEGAGYAGGIMSAAVDGLRIACRLIEEFDPDRMEISR